MNWVPGLGSVPADWRVLRARRVLDRQRRPVRPEDGVVTVFRDGQVVLRSARRAEGFTEAVHEIGYQGCRAGDLAVHAMDGFAGAMGIAQHDGKVSPVVHLYRPRNDEVDLRFVAYVLKHMASNGYVQSLAKGIRERSTSFDPATLADVELPVPGLSEQRRIADYLDEHVAHLDRLVTVRQEQVIRLQERLTSLIDEGLAPWEEKVAVVALCERIVDCVNKTAPTSFELTPYKMIRTSNVRGGSIDLTDALTVDEKTFAIWNRRGAPQAGDVILTREAPVGEVGLLDAEDTVFLGQRTVLYRADRSKAMPEFLALGLMSRDVRRQMDLLGAGSLHPHLRVGDCLKLRLPSLSLSEQRSVVPEILAERERTFGLIDSMRGQSRLFLERKRSLITAAVTGAFDVTTSRSAA